MGEIRVNTWVPVHKLGYSKHLVGSNLRRLNHFHVRPNDDITLSVTDVSGKVDWVRLKKHQILYIMNYDDAHSRFDVAMITDFLWKADPKFSPENYRFLLDKGSAVLLPIGETVIASSGQFEFFNGPRPILLDREDGGR